jgi:chromosome partitioning protein
MCKIISAVSIKGGAAKSTTCANLGAALAASDSVIIPVEAHYLGTEGLRLIIDTIAKVKKRLNPKLAIEGVVITKFQSRTNCCRQVREYVEEVYGGDVRIYDEPVNYSIKVAENAACGMSVIEYDPKGQPAAAYTALANAIREGVEQNDT